ncbi:MAG: hypothetical protein Q9M35_06900 [Rhodothermus sp.]|nr:hypothetical protein [Rhodothermus sp.]
MRRPAYTSYMRTGFLFKWSLLLGWLMGCQRSVPVTSPVEGFRVIPGRFVVVLQGAVADTLEGAAYFRRDTSGGIVIDLVGRPDAERGLSLELSDTAADTLAAVRRRVPGPEPGAFVVGYLAWPPYTFITEAGSLVLAERTRPDLVAGTFHLIMGTLAPHTGEPLDVEAIGAFAATFASEETLAP